jgi:uncharacterized protein (DUF1919 family)
MLKRVIRKTLLQFDKLRVSKDFIIVSNNCFGAEIYRRLNKPYNTPFVGLFIMADSYIRLLENFHIYMNKEIEFKEVSDSKISGIEYPIGYLDDIEIHFMHYMSKSEAKEKWERRTKRMFESNADMFFKFDDRDGANQDHFRRFGMLNFENKISFSVKRENSNSILIKQTGNSGETVPDGVALYNVCFQYIDLYAWLNARKIMFSTGKSLRSRFGLI